MPYTFELNWKAGKVHLIADAFSRTPVGPPEPQDIHAVWQIAAVDKPLEQTILTGAMTNDYQSTLRAIKDRKDPSNLPPDHPARELEAIWQYLPISEQENLIIYDSSKVFIPEPARQKVIIFFA